MMNDRDAVHQNTAPTLNIAAVPATDRPLINQGGAHKMPRTALRKSCCPCDAKSTGPSSIDNSDTMATPPAS